jgi:hypothetical protein
MQLNANTIRKRGYLRHGPRHSRHKSLLDLCEKLQLQLIYDRQSVGQSVLVSGAHLGPVTNLPFSLKFLLDSYGVCNFVAPSLRGWVCKLLFTRRNRPPDSLLKLNGRNIPFVNSVKYLGVLFDKRMTWR